MGRAADGRGDSASEWPSPDPKLAFVVIGITLILSAYTLLVLAFRVQDQVRALNNAENPTERKLWLGFQLLLLAATATAVIWRAWPIWCERSVVPPGLPFCDIADPALKRRPIFDRPSRGYPRLPMSALSQ